MYKVLHVGKYYAPYKGGIETYLEAIAKDLSKVVDIEVLVANHGNDSALDICETIDGVPVYRMATRFNLAGAPICPALIAKLRSSDAQLLHVHLPNPVAVLACLAARPSAPMVVSYHSDIVRQKALGMAFEPIQQLFLRKAAAIIAASPNYLSSSKSLFRHLERCHVIPYGIDIESKLTRNEALIEELRERYGPRLVLAVGRHVYYKGFEFLLQAMTLVNDARLLLIGDGPLRPHLEQLVEQLGISERVIFAGSVASDLTLFFQAADIFVLPSVARSEAFGIVQIEAMAAGTPVINTQLDSGVPFVSIHGETGMTVPPCDPKALADAINFLLHNDEVRRSYGEAARQRAQSEFSLQVMSARTLDLYDRVLGVRLPRNTAARENFVRA